MISSSQLQKAEKEVVTAENLCSVTSLQKQTNKQKEQAIISVPVGSPVATVSPFSLGVPEL